MTVFKNQINTLERCIIIRITERETVLEPYARLNAKPNFILLSIMVILNSCLKYGAFSMLGLM